MAPGGRSDACHLEIDPGNIARRRATDRGAAITPNPETGVRGRRRGGDGGAAASDVNDACIALERYRFRNALAVDKMTPGGDSGLTFVATYSRER
jgi:hypothetical protein